MLSAAGLEVRSPRSDSSSRGTRKRSSPAHLGPVLQPRDRVTADGRTEPSVPPQAGVMLNSRCRRRWRTSIVSASRRCPQSPHCCGPTHPSHSPRHATRGPSHGMAAPLPPRRFDRSGWVLTRVSPVGGRVCLEACLSKGELGRRAVLVGSEMAPIRSPPIVISLQFLQVHGLTSGQEGSGRRIGLEVHCRLFVSASKTPTRHPRYFQDS